MERSHTFAFSFLGAVFAFALSQSILAETLVTAPRPVLHPYASDIRIGIDNPGSPWLQLSQNGFATPPVSGALSPSTLRFRGFSSNQLSVNLDGFSLSDPGTGLIDPHDLPFFASTRAVLTPGVSLESLGGSLNFEIAIPSDFMARSKASLGLRNFSQMDFVVASGELGTSRLMAGLQLASNAGNYPFRISKNSDILLERTNNDQSRILAVAKSQHSFENADLEFFAFGRHHEGGLPGPALFPTNGLRLLSQKMILGGLLSFDLGSFPMSLRAQSKLEKTETKDNRPSSSQSVRFMENSVKLTGSRQFQFADTFASLCGRFSSNQTLDGRFRRLSTQLYFDMSTAPFRFWDMRLSRSAGLEYHSDIGWFLAFSTNISASPLENFRFGTRFGKNSRPPTLSEMFAPQGIVLGNPNLEPEKVYDASLYFNYNWEPKLKLDLEFLYAYLMKAIFYVNRNSFYLEPINADKVHRGTVSLTGTYSPVDLLAFQLRVDYLFSRITATDSPLPGTTPFSMSFETRVGKEKEIHAKISSNVSAGSSSNLFGTLRTDPYALFNANIHFPINTQTRFVVSATNLFDVKWAQSTYQYPMPGFEIFATLEINS